MHNPSRTNQELLEEISFLKHRIQSLELLELKHAATEKALKASEGKYSTVSKMLRLMCDTVPDMIWAKDLERRFIFTNRAVCQGLLNATDTDEPVGKTDMYFVMRERESCPDNPQWHTFGEICIDSDKVVMESRKPAQFDEFGNVKGKFLFLDVHKAPLFDENGKMIGTVGSGRDITAIKHAENALRESEQKYRLLADRMSDTVWMSDLNFNTTYVSPSVKFVLGISPEERMKISFEDQVTPETYTRVMERLALEMTMEGNGQVDPDRTITMQMEYYHRNGSTVWMENIVSAIRDDDGQLIGLQGVARNITERKQVEETLKESEDLFRVSMEKAPDGVYMNDLEGNFLYGNGKAEEIIGYRREELIGRNFLDLNIIAEKSIGKAAELLKANIEGKSTGPDVIEMIRKDGHHILAEISTNVIQRGGQTNVLAFVRDITERRKANDIIRRQTDAMEAAIDGMAILNEKGKYIYLNKAHAKIYGYDNAEELVGKPWRILYDADVIKHFDQEIMPEFARKGDWRGESIGTKKNGAKFPQEISLTAMTNGGMICVVRDITARKWGEEKLLSSIDGLQEASSRYEALIAASNTGAWEYNDNSGFLWCSPEYFSMLGRDICEFDFSGARNIEQTWIALLHSDDLERASSHFTAYLKNPVGMYEQYFRMLHRDGHWIWIWSRGQALRNKEGKLTGITVGTHIDITERKVVERALQESEAKYRQLVENINQGVLVAQDGMLKFVNPMCIKVMGYSEHDLMTRSFIEFIHPDDRLMVMERHVKRMEGEDLPSMYEFRIVTCTGSTNWVEMDSVMIQWEGKPAALAFLSDITSRKLLESELLQAQKMEAIGTLSGGIAHDFNNILGAMIGYTELAMMEQDEGHRQSDLKQVLQACERATSLVSQILTFSRKSDVDKKPINIGYIVKEAVKLLRATIPTTIEIKQRINSKSMVVHANHTQIHQVMMNLYTNAAHAMRKKGGVLEIKLSPYEITSDSPLVSLELTPGSYLKLEVSDTGEGIDQAHMNRIFDPFFTTKGVSEGTGLGLSVVYGIVKGHGGTITVDSVLGSGSTFTVYIPTLQHQDTKEEIEVEEIRHGDERILFVDDEPMLSALGREMLQKSGYKVTNSTDSTQALEMFTENPAAYDLIITDMAMPCLMGIDLAKEIWKIRPQTPIILCTGHSDLIDEDQAKKEGIRRFIMKPLRHRELAKAVRDVLDENKQIV